MDKCSRPAAGDLVLGLSFCTGAGAGLVFALIVFTLAQAAHALITKSYKHITKSYMWITCGYPVDKSVDKKDNFLS